MDKYELIKKAIFWIFIILFAYFVFSGGLNRTYNSVKENIKQNKIENPNQNIQIQNNSIEEIEKNNFDLIESENYCYTSEMIYQQIPNLHKLGDLNKQECVRNCLYKNLYYHSYKCIERDLYCYCKE